MKDVYVKDLTLGEMCLHDIKVCVKAYMLQQIAFHPYVTLLLVC